VFSLGAALFLGLEVRFSTVRRAAGTRYAYQLSHDIGILDKLDGAVLNNTPGNYTYLHPVASAGMFQHFVGLCRKNA